MNPKAERLVIVTNNYPFEANYGEVMFIHPEISRLTKEFREVVVVPLFPYGRNLYPDSSCELDLSLAKILRAGKLWRIAIFVYMMFQGKSLPYIVEIIRALKRWGISGAKTAGFWSLAAASTEYWLQRAMDANLPTIFYTYWNTASTYGLAKGAKSTPAWSVVTRVHGFDLYEERSDPPYLPFRPSVYHQLKRIFTVSSYGCDYLVKRGIPRSKIRVARLGVDTPGFVVAPSSDGKLRIVSCSGLVPVKRVLLLAASVCEFARRRSLTQVVWTHLGDGPDRSKVLELLGSRPWNLEVNLAGQLTSGAVIDYYRSHACDLFVHVSESEGLPVSMMEACCIGLPIIATDVGGVGEIVGESNGFLLPKDPTVPEVVQAIEKFFALDETERVYLRDCAQAVWAEQYNAEKNHSEFALFLRQGKWE